MIPERPCLPPEMEKLAAAAERRREEALNRLLRKLHDAAPFGDDFERQMFALIDADKRKDR